MFNYRVVDHIIIDHEVFCFLNEHFFSQLKRGISVGFYAIV
jgi:hypothetical protein